MAAERLCYAAFETVDHNALAAYDAYAKLLRVKRRAEEQTVRAQERLADLIAMPRVVDHLSGLVPSRHLPWIQAIR
jgi:hypothetical protein